MKIKERKNGGVKVLMDKAELWTIKSVLANFRNGCALDTSNDARLEFYHQARMICDGKKPDADPMSKSINMFLMQTLMDESTSPIARLVVKNSKYSEYLQ